MRDIVTIKGNQHGLSIYLDEASTYEEIKIALIGKLEGARQFFGANKVTLSFEGKTLDSKEENELAEVFSIHSDLQIICIVDSSKQQEAMKDNVLESIRNEIRDEVRREIQEHMNKQYENKIAQYQDTILNLQNKLNNENTLSSNIPEDFATFHYSTLRSGQQIITSNSVIVMGDVNNGSRIESGGSVIVIGKLKGVVHAGLKNEHDSFVVALEMKPVQLRIGNVLGRASDESDTRNSKSEPQIAFVEIDRIVMEPIHNQVYKDLRLLKNM